MNLIGSMAAAAAGCGAAAFTYGVAVEAKSFRLRRVTAPALRRGQRPLRILHLSDMHITPRQLDKANWVAGLAKLRPDLVIDTGDNLAHLLAVPSAVKALEPLMELPGAFVMGSNDYLAPLPRNPFTYFAGPTGGEEQRAKLPTHELTAAFTDAGWVDLNNARGMLDVGGRRVDLVGVDDPHLDLDRYPDVAAPRDPDADVALAVAHAPYLRVLDAMTVDRPDLVLAGHTHGGQVCVPGVGALVTNCDLPRRYAKGLHRWKARGADTWMHISAGLGTNPYTPFRFACPPEATLLTLVSPDD